MIRIHQLLFLGILGLASCEKVKNEEQNAPIKNQLVVTADGDTLENGFWISTHTKSLVSKSGNFENGYRTGEWIYKSATDSVITNWSIVDTAGVVFNLPDHFKKVDKVEPPIFFQADIEDSDNNTYLVFLRYNLTELKSSIYDYLYQYNLSWKSNKEETLKWKEFKKFSFRGIEIFRARIKTQRELEYEAVSYFFVAGDYLYDLTYKNKSSKINELDLEIFQDVLYSVKSDTVDLFNYNNQKYSKEESIEFE